MTRGAGQELFESTFDSLLFSHGFPIGPLKPDAPWFHGAWQSIGPQRRENQGILVIRSRNPSGTRMTGQIWMSVQSRPYQWRNIKNDSQFTSYYSDEAEPRECVVVTVVTTGTPHRRVTLNLICGDDNMILQYAEK